MHLLKQFMNKVIYTYDIELSEVQSVLAKLSIGISIIIYLMFKPKMLNSLHNTLDSFPIAILLGSTAILHLVGLVKNKEVYRQYANLFSCIMWVFISVVISAYPVFSFITATFALTSALGYWRLTGVLSRNSRREYEELASSDSTIYSISDKRVSSMAGVVHNSENRKV